MSDPFGNVDWDGVDHTDVPTGDPIPAGLYLMQASEVAMKPTAKGGSQIEIVWDVIDGDFTRRKVWETINCVNTNPKAVEIGQKRWKMICVSAGSHPAAGITGILSKPCVNKVLIEAGSARPDGNGMYPPKNKCAPTSYPMQAYDASKTPRKQQPPAGGGFPQSGGGGGSYHQQNNNGGGNGGYHQQNNNGGGGNGGGYQQQSNNGGGGGGFPGGYGNQQSQQQQSNPNNGGGFTHPNNNNNGGGYSRDLDDEIPF